MSLLPILLIAGYDTSKKRRKDFYVSSDDADSKKNSDSASKGRERPPTSNFVAFLFLCFVAAVVAFLVIGWVIVMVMLAAPIFVIGGFVAIVWVFLRSLRRS